MREDDDVPVVLLHGVGLDRTVWARVEALLCRRTMALDLPGHGAQPPLTAPTTLAEMAADVALRLPPGPVHLVGFSLGALIAQKLAVTQPGRVRSLTCVSSVCARTEEESDAVRQRLVGAREDFAGSMERALDRWFPTGEDADSEQWRAETREVLLRNDPESYGHAYTVFATGDRDIEPELSGIAVPTLAITGELDPGSTPEMSFRLRDRIAGTEVDIVPGARHMLPVTNPHELVDRLGALIDKARHGTAGDGITADNDDTDAVPAEPGSTPTETDPTERSAE
ncbi:3-oxoadipate enol-lactonase [Mycobacteroides abscessus subsp. abscessus]|nr:3-oxoadipate enol-lactonase [Mycobacteroides abscessus subsp. abscessus]